MRNLLIIITPVVIVLLLLVFIACAYWCWNLWLEIKASRQEFKKTKDSIRADLRKEARR